MGVRSVRTALAGAVGVLAVALIVWTVDREPSSEADGVPRAATIETTSTSLATAEVSPSPGLSPSDDDESVAPGEPGRVGRTDEVTLAELLTPPVCESDALLITVDVDSAGDVDTATLTDELRTVSSPSTPAAVSPTSQVVEPPDVGHSARDMCNAGEREDEFERLGDGMILVGPFDDFFAAVRAWRQVLAIERDRGWIPSAQLVRGRTLDSRTATRGNGSAAPTVDPEPGGNARTEREDED